MSTLQKSAILLIVEKLVEESTNLRGNLKPGRRGGCLTVLVRGEPGFALCSRVGIFVDDPEQYLTLSQEKAERLQGLWHKHLSSWQSRDPDNGRWGGAIIADQLIFSFSGLPELVDEAVVTAAAYWLGEITEYSQVLKIADISRNPFTEELVARMVNWPSLADFQNSDFCS
ncbi:MAG: hypothetical protein QG603_341 [Patescibacteria group bacterium]|jgi:hypothetical protein|nr:hypothetical protein [Patescibacteria group bacterium]